MPDTVEAIARSRLIAGYAPLERNGALVPRSFERRASRPHDLALEILFCGMCHSDLHAVGHCGQAFPLVPGHEIVGRVTATGGKVSRSTAGDVVAVGVIVDSCRVCAPCVREMETYCQAFLTTTYDGIDQVDGSRTRDGFSDFYVCDERFVHHVPVGLDLALLVCAGITT